MPVFLLMIKCTPDDENPDVGNVVGAFVNCFIDAEMFEQAEETALKFLKNNKWTPVMLEDSWELTEDDYKDDPNGLEIYRQVLIDKEIYNFHTYESEDDE